LNWLTLPEAHEVDQRNDPDQLAALVDERDLVSSRGTDPRELAASPVSMVQPDFRKTRTSSPPRCSRKVSAPDPVGVLGLQSRTPEAVFREGPRMIRGPSVPEETAARWTY
jgi:hypothetical protein